MLIKSFLCMTWLFQAFGTDNARAYSIWRGQIDFSHAVPSRREARDSQRTEQRLRGERESICRAPLCQGFRHHSRASPAPSASGIPPPPLRPRHGHRRLRSSAHLRFSYRLGEYYLIYFDKRFQPDGDKLSGAQWQNLIKGCLKLDGNKYDVSIIGSLDDDLSFENERLVIGDISNKTATCSCRMFERTGLLCGHGLKVLDMMNIKTLPTHYILKRWTREARRGTILDKQGRNVVENPKLEAMLRYKELSHKFHSMAYKVASSMECCLLLENALDSVGPKLEEKLNASTSVMNEPSNDKENASPNVQQTDDLLRAAQLKKKEVQSKGLKRKKTWLDKLCKGKRKATKPVSSTKKGAKQHKRKDDVQPQVEVKDDGHKKEANVESGKYNVIETFTQLLTAPPTCVGDSFYGGILF